jgi:Mrp family chromosome partitioning ATPase
MGQIVFVVEANQTSQGAVKEALALLDDSKPIGLVLNKARKIMTSDYYGYGSYSSYHPVADEVR